MSNTTGKRRARNEKPKPVWRPEERALYFGAVLIKQFRRRAKNQELILAAFAEQGWPKEIDDPLSGDGKVSSRRRLHDTIKHLNRGLNTRLLRFHGDGTGCRVSWEWIRAQ